MDDREKARMSAFEDIGRSLDRELQRLVDFVNDRVVPTARQDSEVLLRRTAAVIQQLADKLAARRAEPSEPPPTTAGPETASGSGPGTEPGPGAGGGSQAPPDPTAESH